MAARQKWAASLIQHCVRTDANRSENKFMRKGVFVTQLYSQCLDDNNAWKVLNKKLLNN